MMLALQITEQVHSKVGAAVVKTHFPVQLCNPVHFFVRQFEVSSQICLDSLRRLGLGENGMSQRYTPGYYVVVVVSTRIILVLLGSLPRQT